MSDIQILLGSVRSYLLSQHMNVDNEWLSGCVEYLKDNSESNLTEAEIKQLAREQWLLNDLKDICPGSLPTGVLSQLKSTLNGKYVLQINAAIDIGTPAYQQYVKLQKINMENVEATTKFEEKVPNHRMIKLYLTDGVQDITAIEYKPMRNISCDVTPGCKILLKGPIECRRGMLLLTESSVELLGGEVEDLTITNSMASLLCRKLNVPMVTETNHNTTISHPRNSEVPTLHTQLPPPEVESAAVSGQTSRPIARVTSLQVANFNDDDIDIEQLNTLEAQLQSPVKRPMLEANDNPEKRPRYSIDDYPDDIDFVVQEDEEYLKEIEAQFSDGGQTNTVSVSSEPYVYIKQIQDLSDSEKVGKVFKVKAQIIKLLSKLSCGKDGWSLKCTIVDGTGSLDAEFTNDVLSDLVGFTPQEMNRLKKEIVTKPELKEKAVAALQKAKDALQVLYCIIELTALEDMKITKLTPFNDSHVDLLQCRVHKSGL